MSKRKPPYSGLFNCVYCGRFIAWGNFADGKAELAKKETVKAFNINKSMEDSNK